MLFHFYTHVLPWVTSKLTVLSMQDYHAAYFALYTMIQYAAA